MHSDRLKNVCKLGTLLVFSGVIHAGTILTIDGSAGVTGLPGSLVGWGFSVSSDSGIFPLFTGSQFTPDPNADGVYQDYLASSFFFGSGGSTVDNPFDPFTLGGAGEFDISSTASLGDSLVGSLQLFWDEYSVSPMDPAFDPQADLLQPGQSQTLDVSVSVDTPPPPVSSEAPEPSAYWLCLAGVALCAIGKRRAGRSAGTVAVLAALMIFHHAAQAQSGTLPNLTSTEKDALNILRYNNGIEAKAGACHPGTDPTIVTGCCGSPGVTGCLGALANPTGTNPASGYYCTAPSSNTLRIDSYDTLSGGGHPIDCNLPPPSCDTAVTTSIQRLAIGPNPTPQSVTFYFTSDIHFYRSGSWEPENQIRHVTYLSNPGALSWTYAGDPIAAPQGLVIGGDIGTDASSTDVGAFRLIYENNVGASLRMPMFFGLGNHETVTETDVAGAHRMFDYVTGRMNCGGISQDPLTGNYSWDWGRLHLVMLNTWADDTTGKYNQNIPGHGLTWLANDLANSVGATGRPVILFQHYGFTGFSFDPTQDGWTTQNATDFLNVVKNYNIVGIFNGHTHSPSVQRVDATDWAATAGTLKDSAGNEKVIDVFTNGTGGEDGSGDFIAVRYQDGMTPDSAPYLDVESVHWDNTVGVTKGITTTSTHPEGEGSDYYGQRSACRKRIDTRFNDLQSLVNITLFPNPSPAPVDVRIANPAHHALPGPLALQVTNGGNAPTNVDFSDSCGTQGANSSVPTHSYVLLSDAQIAALNNGQTDVNLLFSANPSSLAVTLVALTPLQGAAPVANLSNAVTSSSIDVIIPGSPADPPASTQTLPLSAQSFYAFGPPGASFTVDYQYTGGAGESWISSGSPFGVFDVTGRTLVTFNVDPNKVAPVDSNTPGATFTVICPADPLNVAAKVLVTVHFKAPITISVTEAPATFFGGAGSLGVPPALITAVLQYTPFKDDLGDNQTPSGQVILADATLDANGNIVSTTPVTYQFVNSTTSECPFGDAAKSPSNNTVIFGDTGNAGIPTTYEGYCPSFVNPTTPFLWGNLPLGLHHFVVQYSGDNAFAPSTSQEFDYLVVIAPNEMTVTSGNGQSTLTGAAFAQPLAAKLTVQNIAPQPGIPVTFTAPASGPSGFFPGMVSSVTVRTDSHGVATAPALTANGVPGAFAVSATLPIVSTFLSTSFSLTNLPVPQLTASISAKSGSLTARVWTVNVTNTQGPATGAAISSIAFTQVAGAACTPIVGTPLPISLGDIAAGASASTPVSIYFGSCASTARFTVAIGVTSNGGTYQRTTSIGNQFP